MGGAVLLWMTCLALAGDVEAVLTAELTRAMTTLSAQDDPPHYVSLATRDVERVEIAAADGALANGSHQQHRLLDVDVRVGTPQLDSTHELRGESALDDDTRDILYVGFAGEDVDRALAHAVWRELDTRYREARERIVLLRGNQLVRVEEEDPAPDWTPRQGAVDRVDTPALVVDEARWREIVQAMSSAITGVPGIIEDDVRMVAVREEAVFIDTEGARQRYGRLHARLGISVTAIAPDGDRVSLYKAFDVHDPTRLPNLEVGVATARALARDVIALRDAPRVGPYTGPVLLSGRSTGVFFHEVMGHRVEGNRQRSDEEGKTFLEYVGKPVLPPWLDVVDDPTTETMLGIDLNGFYRFDDEGVAASKATLVDDGIFRGFLMSRTPLSRWPDSNGHGRRSPGNAAAARMGNTIVTTSRPSTDAELRATLLKEAKAQGLDFAYAVDEIDGGFTLTGREIPNAFNVRASVTRRVFVDGRPDELVRGIDLVGTPLVAFQSIIAAGGTSEVFNGVCGAESGWVPVSAVAPAMVFKRLEFQLKEKESQRPPLLGPPVPPGVASKEVR